MVKMFLKLIFLSFILFQCAFALKCITGLTESPPTVADNNLISVECPPSFELCERRNWISDAGARVIYTQCANAERCSEPCGSLPSHITSNINPKLRPGVLSRIACAHQCCDVDNCNNSFLNGGREVHSSTRTTTVEPQVTNGGQLTKDSIEFLTTSSVTLPPRKIPTTTTAPSSEEQSTIAIMQITEVPSTADEATSTTTTEFPNLTSRTTTTMSSTPVTETTSPTTTKAPTPTTTSTTTPFMTTTSSTPVTETTSTTTTEAANATATSTTPPLMTATSSTPLTETTSITTAEATTPTTTSTASILITTTSSTQSNEPASTTTTEATTPTTTSATTASITSTSSTIFFETVSTTTTEATPPSITSTTTPSIASRTGIRQTGSKQTAKSIVTNALSNTFATTSNASFPDIASSGSNAEMVIISNTGEGSATEAEFATSFFEPTLLTDHTTKFEGSSPNFPHERYKTTSVAPPRNETNEPITENISAKVEPLVSGQPDRTTNINATAPSANQQHKNNAMTMHTWLHVTFVLTGFLVLVVLLACIWIAYRVYTSRYRKSWTPVHNPPSPNNQQKSPRTQSTRVVV